jgi:hypothetical protein
MEILSYMNERANEHYTMTGYTWVLCILVPELKEIKEHSWANTFLITNNARVSPF